MKIALIPPKCNYPSLEPNLEIIGQAFPYLAAALSCAGHEVVAVDINYQWCDVSAQMTLYESILEVSRAHEPDMYGVGGLSGDFSFVRDAIACIRNIAPDKPIICGGGIITYDLHYVFPLLKPDYAVVGEGEEVLVALLTALQSDTGLEQVSNIAYWHDGEPRYNQMIFSSSSLDGLPFPLYEPFNYAEAMDSVVHANHMLGHSRNRPRILPITMGRSCPYSCTFCCHSAGPKYRQRSIDNGLGEILHFYDKYRFNFLMVYDELFSATKGRLVEFSEKIIQLKKEHGLDFDWACGLRVNDVDRATLKVLKESGCVLIGYGLESASQRVLDSMKKKTTVAQITSAREMTEQAGIAFQGNFIYGDVAETEDTMLETWRYFAEYCRDLAVHNVPVTPYPGSDIFDHCLQKGIVPDKQEYYHSIGGIGQLRINMSTMPDERFFSLMDQILFVTNHSEQNTLDLKFGKIGSWRSQGEFLLDSPLLLAKRRELVEFEVTCPHCRGGYAKTILLNRGQLATKSHVRLYCAHCHKRFLIGPLTMLATGTDMCMEDVSAATPQHPEAGASSSVTEDPWENHTLPATGHTAVGDAERLADYAAAGLIGNTNNALAGLRSLPQTEEVTFYTGVTHWMAGDEDAASSCLARCANNEHARNLLALIRKPHITVLSQLPWVSQSTQDILSGVEFDQKFIVRNVGFKPQDIQNRPYADVHEFYDQANPPDFYITQMAEWHLIPPNIQELSCPVFAQTSDYDLHIQCLHPWLKLFDELIVNGPDEQAEVAGISGVPVSVYPKTFSIPDTLPTLPERGQREIDFFMSGTSFHPYHPDKAALFNQILELPDFYPLFYNGFLASDSYYELLKNSKISMTFVRHADAMPTRGLEALAMGAALLVQEKSVLNQFLGENEGVVTYTDHHDLVTAIQRIKREWPLFEERVRRGADIVRRDFNKARVASQYLRFLTVLAAKPRLARRMQSLESLEQKRAIVARGWKFPHIVYKTMQQVNATRWLEQVTITPSARILNDLVREFVLDFASKAYYPFAHIYPVNFDTCDYDTVTHCLTMYRQGVARFPRSLVLRFNLIRTAVHFGSPREVDDALALLDETLGMEIGEWIVEPLDDVMPWDFFAGMFNYRAYFDEVMNRLKGHASGCVALVNLMLASLFYYRGHYSNAVSDLERAVSLDQEFPFYRFRLAALLMRGDNPDAIHRAAELLEGLARHSMLFNEVKKVITFSPTPLCLPEKLLLHLQQISVKSYTQKHNSETWDTPFLQPSLLRGHDAIKGKAPSGVFQIATRRDATHKSKQPDQPVNILFIPLETPLWTQARADSYLSGLVFEEGFCANDVQFLTIPMQSELPSEVPAAWLHHARTLCAGQEFDQVWIDLTYYDPGPAFMEWLVSLAPIRLALITESLSSSPEDTLLYPCLNISRLKVEERLRYMTHAVTFDEYDARALNNRSVVKALWCPLAVPSWSVATNIACRPISQGAVWGGYSAVTRDFLGHGAIASLLDKIPPVERGTIIPHALETANRATMFALNNGMADNELLATWLHTVRCVRRTSYALRQAVLHSTPLLVDVFHSHNILTEITPKNRALPISCIEALAAGCPVITEALEDFSHTARLFGDRSPCGFYRMAHPEELAEQIRMVSRNPEPAWEKAHNTLNLLRSGHTIEVRVAQILRWLQTGEEPDYCNNVQHRSQSASVPPPRASVDELKRNLEQLLAITGSGGYVTRYIEPERMMNDGNGLDAVLTQFSAALAEKKPDLARTIIEQAADHDVRFLPYLAYFYQATGDVRKAEEFLLAALSLDEFEADPHAALALLAYQSGRQEVARCYCESALSIGPSAKYVLPLVRLHRELAGEIDCPERKHVR